MSSSPNFPTGVETMPAAAATATLTKPSTDRSLELIRYINLKLAALGQPISESTADPAFIEIAGPLLRNYYQKNQLLRGRHCPVDARIQQFLDCYLGDAAPDVVPRLPSETLVLDR